MLSRVQGTGTVRSNATGNIVLTFPTPPAVGNAVIVEITNNYFLGPVFPATFADSRGNTYTRAVSRVFSTLGVGIYYCERILTSGAPWSITFTTGGGLYTGAAIEVTGIGDGVLLLHQTSQANGNSAAIAAPPVALTVDNVLLAAASLTNATQTAITVEALSPAWVQEYEELNASSWIAGEGDTRLLASAAGTSPRAQWSLTTSSSWLAVLAAFTAPVPPPVEEVLNITINSVDRTTQARAEGSLSIEYELGMRGRLELATRDYDSFETAYRPMLDQRVAVTYGRTLFTGTVHSVRDFPLGNPGVGTVVALEAVSDWAVASLRRVAETYAADTTLRQVLEDLLPKYLVPYFSITLEMTGDGPSLPGLVFDFVTVEDAFRTLMEHSAWVYRLTPARVLQWFEVGDKARAITFSAANRNIVGPVKWVNTRREFTNKVFIRYGSDSIVVKRDDWVGDGVSTTHTLTYPVQDDGFGNVIRAQKVNEGGVDYPIGNEPGFLWGYAFGYWEPGRGLPSQCTLIRTGAMPASVPIYISYPVRFPLIALDLDQDDIDARGAAWERLEEAPEIFDLAEAQARAQKTRLRYQGRPREIEIATRAVPDDGETYWFLPGDTVTVDVPARTLPSAAWLVTNVRITVDVDQKVTAVLTLLEGTEAQLSWIEYWREVFGTTSGSKTGSVTGELLPPAPVGDKPAGAFFLGASQIEWVQSPAPVGWIPASGIQITPREAQGARVTVRLRARAGSVTARLQDLTGGATAGSSETVTSTAFVTKAFDVQLAAGHTYELQLLPSLPDTDVQGIGYVE